MSKITSSEVLNKPPYLLYPLLYRHKADKLAVKGNKGIVDTRSVALGGEAYRSLPGLLPVPRPGPAVSGGESPDPGQAPKTRR